MRKRIYPFIFFLALAEALLFSVNSPYIASIISDDLVGTLYSLSSLAAIILLATLSWFIRRAGAGKTLGTLLFAGALVAFGAAYLSVPWVLGALVIFLAIPQVAPAVSDIFIEASSRVRERGRVIGTEFTFMNLAFVISPILAGFIISLSGFSLLYSISGGVFILALILSTRFTKSLEPKRTHPGNLWRGLRDAWRRIDLRFVLFLQFLLQFFFSWMVIYTPLYLIDKFAFSYEALGVIFSIMLIPYVLLEYPLGKIADTRLGEKELLACGFVLMAVTVGVIPIVTSGVIWAWAVLLFGTRVGAAMVEGMSATYFYKKVRVDETDLIALFRDMRPVAYLAGPLLASLIITQLSLPTLFPVLAGIMLLGSYTLSLLP